MKDDEKERKRMLVQEKKEMKKNRKESAPFNDNDKEDFSALMDNGTSANHQQKQHYSKKGVAGLSYIGVILCANIIHTDTPIIEICIIHSISFIFVRTFQVSSSSSSP